VGAPMKPTITSRGVTFARPGGDEKSEQASICNLVEALGGVVYTLGSRRAQYCNLCGARTTDQGTRQSEGLSDLAVYLPPPPRARDVTAAWVFVWIEVKGRHGTLSQQQVYFRQVNYRAHVLHLVGGFDSFLEFCQRGGWVRA